MNDSPYVPGLYHSRMCESHLINTDPNPSEMTFADREKSQERKQEPRQIRKLPLRHAYGNEIDPRSLPDLRRRVFE